MNARTAKPTGQNSAKPRTIAAMPTGRLMPAGCQKGGPHAA
jgi:hypothetical protein